MSSLKPKGCIGCIYEETTNAGHFDGKRKSRYVAEILIGGRRMRFRSTRLDTTQEWLRKKTRELHKNHETH